jgi:host factor-I protein
LAFQAIESYPAVWYGYNITRTEFSSTFLDSARSAEPAFACRCIFDQTAGRTTMKDGMDSTAARQAPERTQEEEFVSRKLIRPSLSSPAPRTEPVSERRERLERTDRAPAVARRAGPPEQTHAENYYYQKQIQAKTPVVIVLKDGEEVQGCIEWYDRNCIKVNRSSASALLIYKPSIRYIYKAGEGKP